MHCHINIKSSTSTLISSIEEYNPQEIPDSDDVVVAIPDVDVELMIKFAFEIQGCGSEGRGHFHN